MRNRLFVFAKAQFSAFTGGIVDYLFMIFITEFFDVYYVISIFISGIGGAAVNFSLNRGWTFHSRELAYRSNVWKQLSKFALVVLNSILLKAAGTYFFTTYFKIDYKVSRIMTDLIVSIFLNYTLQKHWVFRKKESNIKISSQG